MEWLIGYDKGIQQRQPRVAHLPLDRAMRSRGGSSNEISSVEVTRRVSTSSHAGLSSDFKKCVDDPFGILAASEGEEWTRHGLLPPLS